MFGMYVLQFMVSIAPRLHIEYTDVYKKENTTLYKFANNSTIERYWYNESLSE